jgi:hypothetical protein
VLCSSLIFQTTAGSTFFLKINKSKKLETKNQLVLDISNPSEDPSDFMKELPVFSQFLIKLFLARSFLGVGTTKKIICWVSSFTKWEPTMIYLPIYIWSENHKELELP